MDTSGGHSHTGVAQDLAAAGLFATPHVGAPGRGQTAEGDYPNLGSPAWATGGRGNGTAADAFGATLASEVSTPPQQPQPQSQQPQPPGQHGLAAAIADAAVDFAAALAGFRVGLEQQPTTPAFAVRSKPAVVAAAAPVPGLGPWGGPAAFPAFALDLGSSCELGAGGAGPVDLGAGQSADSSSAATAGLLDAAGLLSDPEDVSLLPPPLCCAGLLSLHLELPGLPLDAADAPAASSAAVFSDMPSCGPTSASTSAPVSAPGSCPASARGFPPPAPWSDPGAVLLQAQTPAAAALANLGSLFINERTGEIMQR